MIQIAFASETGNTSGLAELTFTRLSSLGFPCELNELGDLDLPSLSDRRLLLLLTSTFGDGEPPANGEDFYGALMANSAPRLDQLTFSVCALGDSSYELFCQCGKDFDQRLAELGARRIVPRVDCDVGEEEDRWEVWLARITEQIPSIMTIEEGAPQGTTQLRGEAPSPPNPPSPPLTQPPTIAQRISASAAPLAPPPSPILGQQGTGSGRTIGSEGETRVNASPRSPTQAPITRKNPFFARIIRNDNLNDPQSEKETRHVELSLEGSGLTYQVGDSLGLLPRNNSALVDEILHRLSIDRESLVTSMNPPMTIRSVLLYKKDITRIDPRLLQICLRKGMTLPPPLRHQEQWKSYCAENHLVDLLKQSTIRFTISELLEGLRPLAPRLYSISSSQNVHPNSVHLTVNVLRYELNQELRAGVTSSFLAQAELGSHAHIFVQPTKSFHLCEDEKPILLIGPGTGIAPFRAFLQEREIRRARGQSWLFFGAQRSDYDFLYQRELEDWVERGILTRLDTAWSRDQAHKIYVQDLLYQNGYGIWQWLEAGAYIYVCGDAQRMAKDVHQILLRIVREFGGMSAEEAEEYIKTLKSEKRYLRDVY